MRSAGVISVMSLVALLAVQHLAMACTCLWGGPFAKIALGQELVVYGEVLDYYRHSMEVKVLEVLSTLRSLSGFLSARSSRGSG